MGDPDKNCSRTRVRCKIIFSRDLTRRSCVCPPRSNRMTHPSVPALTILAVLFSVTAACAQSAGPIEAIGADGTVIQPVVQPTALTPVQRNALYNTASRHHIQARAGEVAAVVGATVPPSIELGDLPAVPTLGNDPDNVLKYA